MKRIEEKEETVSIRSEDGVTMGDLRIIFHRTVRVPEKKNNKGNSLPANMGNFPVFRVLDFKDTVPEHWKKHEGAFLICMHKHEAMWIGFRNPEQPIALIVGAGMINALTGEKLSGVLTRTPEQNYLVAGHQPWLDGFKTSEGGNVYQFVGAILGEGETVEEQLTGEAKFGGFQFAAFRPKVELVRASRPGEYIKSLSSFSFGATRGAGVTRGMSEVREMGLGAGGAITQKIYPDPYTEDHSVAKIWNTLPFMKTYIYIVDPKSFEQITGLKAPASPITYQTYQKMGLPWYGLFDTEMDDLPGSGKFEDIKKVGGAPDAVIASEKPKQELQNEEAPDIGIGIGSAGVKSSGLKTMSIEKKPIFTARDSTVRGISKKKEEETLDLWP